MTYNITDTFSQQMIVSIPKKINAWLETITKDAGQEAFTLLPFGSFGRLNWQLSPDCGMCGIYLDQQPVIWWNSEFESAIFSTDTIELTDISNNLEYFVNLEQQVYTELEKLNGEINKRANFQTKEQEYKQYAKVEDEKH